jgi:subtilisin family serine protease
MKKIPAFLCLSLPAFLMVSPVPGQDLTPPVSDQISAIQTEKAARTLQERKLSSQLLFLSRESSGKRAVEGAAGLRSRVVREADGRVIVDISAEPGEALSRAITAAGGMVIYQSPRWKSVRASLPPTALMGIAGRAEVKAIRKGRNPVRHTGPVNSEGDAAHNAGASRALYGTNGGGIKVGVISDSCDHYQASVTAGELPLFTVLDGRSGIPASGEGTAMSEIVADLAPGAQIYFASASGGKAFFADSILQLHASGCKVIVDDISYGDEWQFQDDEIGQAVNEVVDAGALYISSSGNEGSLKKGTSTTWEGDYVSGGSEALLPAGTVHRFGTQNYNRLTTDDSDATLQWSDEYHSSANDYDLHIFSADGTTIVASSTDTQDGTQAPMEEVSGVHPGERIVIWKATTAAPRYLRLSCTGSPLEIATAGQTIGHAATAKCLCVAASDATLVSPGPFTAASPVRDSSSDGPHKMFYRPDGTPITPGNFLASGGVTVPSPSLTAATGGATSVPGFSPFYGTSASAPHTAALAAVVWSRKPTLTNTVVRTLLEASCIDIEDPGMDVNSGHGILMADLALAQTRTPQEIWRQTHFAVILPAGDAAPGADPDQDGATNLLEYATGGAPKSPDAPPVSGLALNGPNVVLSYRRNPAATDVTIHFQHSTNLAPWLPLTPGSDNLLSTNGGVEFRAATLPASGPRDFFRLNITTP